jgi:hypothetical protein
LAKGSSPDILERTIDITTIGRRSGIPRRIEICFYRFEDSTYLSGIPSPHTRDWLRNLQDEPHFIFHLKHGIQADLPAVAEVITDPLERRRVFVDFVDTFNRRNGPESPWPRASLDEWERDSPLAKVRFTEID